MNLKTRLTILLLGTLVAFVHSTFFAQPAHKKSQDKLHHATQAQVVQLLGQPYTKVDSTNFIESANQMADDGYPISTADMRAKGEVWMYGMGKPDRAGAWKYRTIFFDQNKRVYAVYTTYWMTNLFAAN